MSAPEKARPHLPPSSSTRQSSTGFLVLHGLVFGQITCKESSRSVQFLMSFSSHFFKKLVCWQVTDLQKAGRDMKTPRKR